MLAATETLNEDQSQQYRDDGVVCLRQAFDDQWLEVVTQSISRGRVNPSEMYLDYSVDSKPGER
ncbi:hypothetical protein AB833_06140 [Chromatiales bacterium (ex Bugula neritina AB1)]|nr:hypothetical protein AB833_06140 [Chromatiales bacterium (ex Bugula neritina AB1)]